MRFSCSKTLGVFSVWLLIFGLIFFPSSLWQFHNFNVVAEHTSEIIRNDVLRNDFVRVGMYLETLKRSQFGKIELVQSQKKIYVTDSDKLLIPIKISKPVSLNDTNDTNDAIANLNVYYDISWITLVDFILSLIVTFFVLKWIEKRDFKKQNEIREKTQFKMARQFAHDIQSPISVLSSLVQREDIDPLERQNLIKKSIERIENASSDLVTNKKQDKKIELIQFMNQLVQEKAHELRREIVLNSQGLNDAWFEGDENGLWRILSNLINNAHEACSDNHVINVFISQKSDKLEIIIQDFGKGISAEKMQQIGKENYTSKSNGNGLGVWGANQFLSKYESSLVYHSKIGKGTSVSFELPYLSINKNARTILIDDDELVRTTWLLKAKRQGIDFLTFKNPEELLSNFSSLDKSDSFYIDSEFSNSKIKGQELACELNQIGFENIYLTTGYSPDEFKQYQFLKGVRTKAPPF